ncbi:MAG: substrate-binding domain-containing protein, partial [Phycisphaeraceae bacterium]|nr:substrate-binding domain-containing protein [Phycisphaeraceae bacterium]
MPPASPRVALMLDIEVGFSRHTDIYSGAVAYAQEQNWEVTVDEFADDSLPARRGKPAPYDGVIARATRKLAERAGKHRIPVVNVWNNSPVREKLPGVFPDYRKAARLYAEHLLARGLIRFAALIHRTQGHQELMGAFRQTIREAGHEVMVGNTPLSASKNLTNWRTTQKAIGRWMDRFDLPIGVLVGSEPTGRIVAQMCRHRGWLVPDDV